MKETTAYAMLLSIVILGVVLSYILYSGPNYMFDDGHYLLYAHQILSGDFTITQSPYAYGYLLPASVALSFWLFGAGILQSILPAMIEYIMIIVFTFLLGKELYDQNTGLLASFFAAVTPFVVCYSTRVLPDLFGGMLATIALYLFFRAARSGRDNQLYFAAGAVCALTIYVKLIGLAYILFFFLAAALMMRLSRKKGEKQFRTMNFVAFAAGIALLFLLYLFTIYLSTGNPLYTINTYGAYQGRITPSSLQGNVAMFSDDFGAGLLAPFVTPGDAPFGFVILVAALGTLISLWKKDRNATVISVVLWGYLFYLYFGTISLHSYTFAFVTLRYFDTVIAPIAILAAYAAFGIRDSVPHGSKNIEGNAIFYFIIIAVMVTNVSSYLAYLNYNTFVSGGTSAFLSMLSKINSNDAHLIFNTEASADFTNLLMGYKDSNNISYLNLSNLNVTLAQINEFCAVAATNSSFLAVEYNNETESEYAPITSIWPYQSCSLEQVGLFTENSPFSSINTQIKLYKVK